MDVFDGGRELLSLAGEAPGFDVDPPAGGVLVKADDEGIVGGGAEARVVEGESGVFVAGKHAGVVESAAEVVSCPGGGAGVPDPCWTIHGPIEEVEAVFVGGAGGGDGHRT